MPHTPKLHPDPDLLALISRCLTRDDAAWQALHDRFDPALRRWIRGRLGPGPVSGDDDSLIAQNVWKHLLLDDYRALRAYDPARTTFATFLYACMKVQLRLWRDEQRDLAAPLDREELIAERTGDLPEAVEMADFLSWIRPVDRQFVRVYQLGEPPPPDQPPLSPGNIRVCRHRVKRKKCCHILLARRNEPIGPRPAHQSPAKATPARPPTRARPIIGSTTAPTAQPPLSQQATVTKRP